MTGSNVPRRQIYHQGFLDGACFLYSVANAYKALTGSKVTREMWDRAIRHVSEPANFFGGVGATTLSYQEAVALIHAMLGAFGEPVEHFEIHQLSASSGVADLCREISPDSVVLFAFGGPTEVHHPSNHIVCGVAAGTEPAVLHVACSAAFSNRHLQDGIYEERFHPNVGRYSNDAIAADSPVEIAPNWRWRLTLVSHGSGESVRMEIREEPVVETRPAVATRLRGVWMGVSDFDRSRAFYEQIGAYFDQREPVDGIVYATLGGTRLVFEAGSGNPSGEGLFLLFDVTDADALHAELQRVGCPVESPPNNEPWGRQFNVRDPDGHLIAFIGPVR